MELILKGVQILCQCSTVNTDDIYGCYCPVTKLCLTLCYPMNCSRPGWCPSPSPWNPLSQWGHPTISSSVIPFSFCLQSFQASGSFQMSQFFTWGGQSIGVSASAPVLPMNIQDWFPLGLIGLISLQPKGLLRVFSSNTLWKHQFLSIQLSLWSTLTPKHDYWKNHSFDYTDLCWQSDAFAF